jgi:hypothetical protein
MENGTDPIYSRQVVEFVAVANECCKYIEHSSELDGEELLRIFQRLFPLLYLKASVIPAFTPVFDEGNEKFVTEDDWLRIHKTLLSKFGSANDFQEVFDARFSDSEGPVVGSLAENISDIYQDLKDFLILYQTGTSEVMNDSLWECGLNFETFWGQKLLNSLRAIHRFIYSGEKIDTNFESIAEKEKSDTSDWFISRRQKEFNSGDE